MGRHFLRPGVRQGSLRTSAPGGYIAPAALDYWLGATQPFMYGVGDSWQGTGHELGIPLGQPMYYIVADRAGMEFGRSSVGGTTFNYAAVNLMATAVASGARCIIIIDGGNDIVAGRTSVAMLADLDTMKAMLQPWQKFFVSEIGPGSYSAPELARIETWNNTELPAWCAANGATKIDINAGLRDPDGTLQTIYDLDGKHLKTAGVLKLAELWGDAIDAYSWPAIDGTVPTIIARTTSAATDATIASTTISPAANSLLVVAVASGNASGTILPISIADTFSGGSLTWTKLQERSGTVSPAGSWGIAVFWAKTGATPGSGVITATFSATMTRDCMIVTQQRSNYNATTPIPQSVKGSSQASTLSLTLPSTPAATSLVQGFVVSRDGQLSAITPGASFTELDQGEVVISTGTNSLTLEVQYDKGSATDTVSWSTLRTVDNMGIAFEVAV